MTMEGINALSPNPPDQPLHPAQYDDEELLLLHLADIDNAPLPSDLEAPIEDSSISHSTSATLVAAPLLMERPKSAGIDVTSFSFSKPLQRGKGFSLRSSKPQQPVPSVPQQSPLPQEGQPTAEDHGDQCNDGPLSASGTHTGLGSDPTHGISAVQQQLCMQQSSLEEQPGPPHQENLERDHYSTPSSNRGPENVNSGVNNSPIISTFENGETRSTLSRARGERKSSDLTRQSVLSVDVDAESRPASRSSAPRNENFRVMKSRSMSGRKRHLSRVSGAHHDGSLDLTEDDLFRLLIGKIKKREDNDIAATTLQSKLKADIFELETENKSLKQQVDSFGSQLQKRTLESTTYKSQIDNWKTKLGKFKRVLNELGGEYQTLRVQSNHLRATGFSLEREKQEISTALYESKKQISQVSSIIDEGRNSLSESREIVNALQHSLKNSEEKAEGVRIRLADEKRRTAVLESYIQKQSLFQRKQIKSMRDDQLEMMEKTKSGFDLISKQWEFSQSNIQSIMKPILEECLASIGGLGEKSQFNQTEIKKSINVMQELLVQVTSGTQQLTSDIGRNYESNTQLINDFKGQAKAIVNSVESNAALLKQLAADQSICGSFAESLESVASELRNLTISTRGLDARDDALVQRVKELANAFSESQAQAQARLDSEACNKAINNELQLQLEEASARLTAAEASLKAKDIENESITRSLSEATAQNQVAESRAIQLESDVAALHDSIGDVERNVREELNRASVVARDQTKAKYEQQLHKALKEKMDVENETKKMREQLANARQSLVSGALYGSTGNIDSMKIDKEASSNRQRMEIESLVSAKENEIQTLRASQTEFEAQITAQNSAIKKYQDLEASNIDWQRSLEQQLDEANTKITNLKDEMSSKEQNQCQSLQELQAQIESLQSSLAQKDEECSSVRSELSAANSAMSTLESAKTKAKAEIHSLLRRVQDSERWMKVIKETLERLGIDTADESFPKTWKRLEALLKPKRFTSTSCNSPAQGSAQNYGTDVTADAPVSITTALTPRNHGSPPEGYFQTELIYRTQSIQSTYSSPAQRTSRSGIGGGIMSTIPDSQMMANNIVPFSSIQKELSPAQGFSQNEDHSDMVNSFMFSPGNRGVPGEICGFKESSQSNTVCQEEMAKEIEIDRQLSQAEIMPGQCSGVMGSNNRGIKRKVTFDTDIPTSSQMRNEAPESHDNARQSVSGEVTNDRIATRFNQRTYSRSRHPDAANNARKASQKDQRSSNTHDGNTSMQPANPHNISDNGANVSSGSYTRPQRRTRRASDYFETRASPTGLASGSSRHSSANGQHANDNWVARRQRRGRRSRGERYNARFNQEI